MPYRRGRARGRPRARCGGREAARPRGRGGAARPSSVLERSGNSSGPSSSTASSFVRTVLERSGNVKTPLDPDIFEQHICNSCGIDKVGGFFKYEQQMRKTNLDRMFHKDKGDIPAAKKFVVRVPCPLAHPELCADTHSHILPSIQKTARSLRNFLKGAPTGSVHCLRFVGPGQDVIAFFAISYKRGSQPAVSIYMPCTFSTDSLLVRVCEENGPLKLDPLLDCVMDTTFLGRVMARTQVDEVFVAHAPVESRVSYTSVLLFSDWVSRIRETQVFPVMYRIPKCVSSTLTKGLRSVQEAPVKYVLPKVASAEADEPQDHPSDVSDEPESGDSDATVGVSQSGSEHPDPEEAQPVPPPALPLPPVPVGAVRWGPWSISPVNRQSIHSGWGGNCLCHTNGGGGNPCQKNMAFGTNTPQETKCLIKKWLLMGLEIPAGPQSRTQHALDVKRSMIPLEDEASLDALAAQLV